MKVTEGLHYITRDARVVGPMRDVGDGVLTDDEVWVFGDTGLTSRTGEELGSDILFEWKMIEIVKDKQLEVVEERKTGRGFRVSSFEDANGVKCSLQRSSIAEDEGYIWLGCDELGLKRFEPYVGWSDVVLENDPHGICHIANTRMHLSQSHVAALLPALTHFVETGELPPLPSQANQQTL